MFTLIVHRLEPRSCVLCASKFPTSCCCKDPPILLKHPQAKTASPPTSQVFFALQLSQGANVEHMVSSSGGDRLSHDEGRKKKKTRQSEKENQELCRMHTQARTVAQKCAIFSVTGEKILYRRINTDP